MLGSNEKTLLVYVDASGKQRDLNDFKNDHHVKRLYFKPDVMNALLATQEARIEWKEKYNGKISSSSDSPLDFSTNDTGLINAIAKDVAMLPPPEKCIWASHSYKLNDEMWEKVKKEQNKRVQLETHYGSTQAPETLLFYTLDSINRVFRDKFEVVLFSGHDDLETFTRKIHRFRAVDEDGLRALAKDVVRRSIERMDKQNLLRALGENEADLEPLEILEKLLIKHTGDEEQMVPLFELDSLGKVGAHSESSDVENYYASLGIDRQNSHVTQGVNLLQNVANAFGVIDNDLEEYVTNRQ